MLNEAAGRWRQIDDALSVVHQHTGRALTLERLHVHEGRVFIEIVLLGLMSALCAQSCERLGKRRQPRQNAAALHARLVYARLAIAGREQLARGLQSLAGTEK